MGEWYKKVNQRIGEAGECATISELIELLGEPDHLEQAGDVETPGKFFEKIGSIFRFGDENAETVLTYQDPYRQRIRYKFGITGNKVTSSWKETVAG